VTQTWEFTDFDFRVLCERYADSHVPEPLTYLARTRYRNDYEREKYEAWERLRSTVDPVIQEVIPVLIHSEVSVRVQGWHDRSRDDPKQWIRARAARSGAQGYIVTQKPGETVSHSGGYTITDCGPRGLAEAVVAVLPPNVEAGRLGSIPIMTDSVDDLERLGGGGSLVTEEVDYSGARRSAEFFDTLATRTGAITIHQGHSKFGPRGILEHILMWRDLPEDGRYVIELPSSAPFAVGMGKKWLATKVEQSIDTMLDRLETHWEL
jgi:hypothetical protein